MPYSLLCAVLFSPLMLWGYSGDNGSAQSVADRLGVSEGMVKKLLFQRKKTGAIANRHGYSGRKPYFTIVHKKIALRCVSAEDELGWLTSYGYNFY